MRKFVRLSLIGLVGLVAIGFALNQYVQTGSDGKAKPKVSPISITEGQCEQAGISLLVDFGSESAKPAIEKCVVNFSGTSWGLFEAAGISVYGTSKYPIGFVCRIEDFPSAGQEPCQDMPKNSVGSWAYFVAGDDSTQWQYSTWGAATHKPGCGTAEAWLFKLPSEDLESPPLNGPKTSVCPNN